MTRTASWVLAASVFVTFPAAGQDTDFSADIADVTQRIEGAERTVSQFDGGVIKALAQYRLEVLKMNRVLLENRQLSADEGISPDLAVPAVLPDPARAAEILTDIQTQTEVVATAEVEAMNSGGLVQAMALTRVETEKLTLAQLKLAWYQAQYGISTPQLAAAAPPPVSREIAKGAVPPAESNAPAWADLDYSDIDYTSGVFSGLSKEGFVMAGWYGIRETRAEIDDSPKVLAINFSDYDPEAFQDKRRLLFQCNEGTPSIVYDVDNFLSYNYRSDVVRVTYRIDGADAVNASWSKLTSNQGTGVFGASSIDLMLQLMKSEKLFLRTYDNNGKTYDGSFDMRGSAKAVEAVAEACGFSTLDLSKEDLKAIQSLLNNAGFDAGAPDGAWGNGSKRAMRAFQESKGLRVTGAPDAASLRALGIEF